MTDTHVHPAAPGVDKWNVLYRGVGASAFRRPPASEPQVRVPTAKAGREYSIAYYPRDVRRNPGPKDFIAIEDTFGERKKMLEAPNVVANADPGSAGIKVCI